MAQQDPRVALMAALVDKFCKEGSSPVHAADAVYDHIEAFERADKVQRIGRVIEQIDQTDRELAKAITSRNWKLIEALVGHFVQNAICVEDVDAWAHIFAGSQRFKEAMSAGHGSADACDEFVTWMHEYGQILIGIRERAETDRETELEVATPRGWGVWTMAGGTESSSWAADENGVWLKFRTEQEASRVAAEWSEREPARRHGYKWIARRFE